MRNNKSEIAPLPASMVSEVAKVLGNELTGTDIEIVLRGSTIRDIDGPQQTKWKRIYIAIVTRQNKDKSGNCVVRFITEAMKLVRYRNNPADWSKLQSELNEILIHQGLRVNDQGKMAWDKGGAAKTLSEAIQRAGIIHKELERRNAHPEVLKYSNTELFQKNNFHAILEASKSIPDRLRKMTSLKTDGASLISKSLFPKENPLIAINAGTDETDHSEQGGFGNLIIGLLGMYRNTTAHPAKINRQVTDEELLEAFSTFSMVHRRLDEAHIKNQ